MPHFGIVDEGSMEPREAMLLRAKVHLRSARRRLRDGYIQEGVATLNDTVDSAMSWYAMDPANRDGLDVKPGEDVEDGAVLCLVLYRSGVISDAGVFYRLSEAAEGMLDGDVSEGDVDADGLLSASERVLEELGVLPFDESELPPEHSSVKR